jgi:hypothetical protein
VLLGGCGAGRTSLLLRLEQLAAPHAQYLDMAAAATTPERCLTAVLAVSRLPLGPAEPSASPRAAFEALLAALDAVRAPNGTPALFLLDEFFDVRTFENFPGLRQVLRDFVAHLAQSPARFVLASKFTVRVHRLLRDASARFEVMHVPPLEVQEVRSLAQIVDGGNRQWADTVAPQIALLSGGRAGSAAALLSALSAMGPATDAVAALASAFSPEGTLTARQRECFEFRLQRARGYGALKAILGILAETEGLNLTEIAQRLQRTPGSTKDYLSWLEDVDLVVVRGKRYSYVDPLLRLYVRLYGRPTPPTDDDIVREVAGYVKTLIPLAAPAVARPMEVAVDAGVRSGIIEID